VISAQGQLTATVFGPPAAKFCRGYPVPIQKSLGRVSNRVRSWIKLEKNRFQKKNLEKYQLGTSKNADLGIHRHGKIRVVMSGEAAHHN
jgi:hypothetical protein